MAQAGQAAAARPGSSRLKLCARGGAETVFRTRAGAISAAAFLADAARTAAALDPALAAAPPDAPVLNLCQDRYRFAVGFAAALLRGRVSLLTSDRAEARVRALLEAHPGAITLADDGIVHAIGGDAPAAPAIPADRPAAIVFTSGSTGVPVGHPKSWGALAARSIAAARRFGLRPGAGAASIIGMVPPQHMYGFETTVLLPLHGAAATWCGPAFFPEDVRAALAAVPAPRVLVTTPLQLRALVQAGQALPSLARIISATAPLPPDLAAAAERAWATEVHEIFGATEVGSIASRRTVTDASWLLYPTVRLVAEAGAEPAVVAPHAVPHGLGDVVETVGARRFRLHGRRADMVKLGGRRASLAGLNRILNELDGVEDGLFVPPDDLEERPTARLLAFVVAPTRSPDQILAALRARIDPVFLPRRVVRVDRLPRNELGKLPRQALARLTDGDPHEASGQGDATRAEAG